MYKNSYFLWLQSISKFKDTVRSFGMFHKIHSEILSLLWWHIYHLIAYKIRYLTVYFVFKRSLAIRHITQGHF